MILGPFTEIDREGGSLRLVPDATYLDRIREYWFRSGLKISGDKILRAYADGRRYWIAIEFKKGYDLYKHLRLAEVAKHAKRIPRIVVEVCPKCGEGLVNGLCVNCGEVEELRLVEVWRDPSAVEVKSGPFQGVVEEGGDVVFVGRDSLRIPRWLVKYTVVSQRRDEEGVWLRILKL